MAVFASPIPEVSVSDVRQAAGRLRGVAHRTPVMSCRAMDRMAGRRLFFKCENFQKVGAFKFRGAMNTVAQLTPEQLKAGVITHSSGNHAQALALAARLRGAAATIVMPDTASAIKRSAVEEYGARVVSCAPGERESTCAAEQEVSGATLIHPFNDPRIIAGQGTAALELLEEVPDLDAIIAPVGGGGLISGTCLAAASGERRVRVLAAEPAGADDAARSRAAGRLIPQTDPHTVADGLLTSLGSLTWPFVRDCVEQVITVEDADTIRAMRTFFQRAKLLVEPSSAVAIAAALALPAVEASGLAQVGVIISGGNVDLDHLPW